MLASFSALSVSIFFIMPIVVSKTSSGWTDATSSAAAARGDFEIQGITGHARHLHGGPPAQIGHAGFTFVNRSAKPQQVSVMQIEFLHGNKDCNHPPAQVASHPKSGGILLDDGVQRESAAQVTVKPGATVGATVGFTAVPAYYVFCDRFAVRVHFLVGGERLTVIDEINITRVEPLRQREP